MSGGVALLVFVARHVAAVFQRKAHIAADWVPAVVVESDVLRVEAKKNIAINDTFPSRIPSFLMNVSRRTCDVGHPYCGGENYLNQMFFPHA